VKNIGRRQSVKEISEEAYRRGSSPIGVRAARRQRQKRRGVSEEIHVSEEKRKATQYLEKRKLAKSVCLAKQLSALQYENLVAAKMSRKYLEARREADI